MEELWSNALEIIKTQVSQHVFEAWIHPLKIGARLSDGRFELLATNDFAASLVKTRYSGLLESVLSEIVGKPVVLLIRPDPEAILDTAILAEADPVTDLNALDKGQSRDFELDPRYTFNSFVVGGGNQFVYAAAEQVAESPATSYNPLFIYGGTGLGKTHILHAIAHHVRQTRPRMKVLYTTSEKFMTQLINAIRFKRVYEFKDSIRSVDMLMVDDIQFLAGKERTQEEFFHTFNTLFEANKQIIITSDQFPNKIEQMEDRLRSRFGWGLVADIQAPDLETRIAILKKKAALDSLELPQEVAFFLANTIDTNVRELEGALIRVTAFASLTRQAITLDLVKTCLRDIIKGQDKQISIEEIQKIVSAFYKIRPIDMRSDKRSRLFSHPRQVAMFLCRQLTNHSYPQIGHHFGGRDHTTVLNAVRTVEKKKIEDFNLEEEIQSLMGMLQK